ncbi:MAG: PDZ domain-containing protein, partial [Muribaculaceae bacterium]|nr:PDZ domain-containing protein [Muribaculaceae bacterium]
MERTKTHFKSVVVALAAAVFFSASCFAKNQKIQIARNLDIFNSLYKELQVFYVDSIDAEKSITTAINAMLNDIDPYTEYIPANEQDDFKAMTTGEYGGIGSFIMERDGNVFVSEPYENSPAHKAGLKAGDRFLKINSDTVVGWRSSKVSEHLKGQAGTELTVVVDRPYVADSIVTVKIMREKIQRPAVTYYGVT